MIIFFPLTFLSNAFVPADSLPSWLRAFSNVNPVSHVVTAVRDLANNGQIGMAAVWAVVGAVFIVAIFLPLAVRAYMRKA